MSTETTKTESAPKRLVRNTSKTAMDWVSPVQKNPGIMLMPGINEVDQEQIDWIENQSNSDGTKGNKLWLFHKRKGTIQFVALETEAEETTSALSFSDMHDLKTDDAIALIQDVHDLGVLEAWQRNEERKGVGAAISKKIKEMTPQQKNAV